MKKKISQMGIFPKKNSSLKSIKDQMDVLAGNWVTKLGLRISFVNIGLSLLILALSFHRLPPEIPLLYSHPYGEGRLVLAWKLWMLPLTSLGITVISMRMAGEEIEKDKLLSQVIIGASGLVSLMSLISVVKVVFLVT